ncbi:MAG: hypothetical protein HZB48_04445 [Actinobacteria bacterium]|nr:hypothetical protein [Actinomycetota bacterium]
MTHMHVAGSIHADVTTPAPVWLTRPEDVNALTPKLWSSTVHREDDGVIAVGGVRLTDLAEVVGTPAYVLDEVDFRERARAWRDAFASRGHAAAAQVTVDARRQHFEQTPEGVAV